MTPIFKSLKIGVALHLEFDEPDEPNGKLNLDVDVSPPTIPVRFIENYDGNNEKKRRWLERHRPANWVSEWRKSYDMTAAGKSKGAKRSVRLRRINRNLVIPEQVLAIFSLFNPYIEDNLRVV